ncbi:hypothetical protein NLG97_g9023 [Lecanicillium saksenae]|uniref:Uncharacterized protein n=1 Tax=Lecanicillium saksenae TaxID=468837 RepID=A0ACC1QHE6_9HYPO|nr:hypothetical protein NLG97_g9023 [Lecanicillium saksenae]
MPGKAGVWENADFLVELSLALFQIASKNKALSVEAKSAVEAYLKTQGYDQSWESVRQELELPRSKTVYFVHVFVRGGELSGCLYSSLCTPPELPLPLPSSKPFQVTTAATWLSSLPIHPCHLAERLLNLPICLLFPPQFRLNFSQKSHAIVVMGRSQMRWDANAHEDMLICIVKHCELNSQNMARVLSDMQQKGYEFTENAFRRCIMSEKPVRGWNTNSHEALLFAIIEEFRPNKDNVTAITKRLNAMGYGYTFHAVNQHIQKLRKARDTTALDGSGGGSKPSTPRKATPRKTPTSSRKRKVDEDADELGFDPMADEEDEDDTKVTPSKRIKNEPSSETPDWKKSIFKDGEF